MGANISSDARPTCFARTPMGKRGKVLKGQLKRAPRVLSCMNQP